MAMLDQEILSLQRELLLEKLKDIDKQMGSVSLRPKKGYTLRFLNGKFFVQYIDAKTGKYLPLKRSLGTSDREEAEKRAAKFRDAFIEDYERKKSGVKDIYELFSNFWKPEKSTHLREMMKRNQGPASAEIIKKYDGYMNNHFIDFLEQNNFTKINEINNVKVIKSFQNYLLDKNISAHTINTNIVSGVIKPVYAAVLGEKSCFNTNTDFSLKSKKQPQTGSTPQKQTLDVVNNLELWKIYKNDKLINEKTYKKFRLWCLLAATTGLREGEIFHLRKSDIHRILDIPFLFVNEDDGRKLKTESSIRKVPLPLLANTALKEYIKDNNIQDYLFCKNGSMSLDTNGFMFAFQQLCSHLGFTRQDMIENRFRFHSLRVLYATFLNTSGLQKDIIEHFMGHKVDMGSMRERYNNRNDLDEDFYANYGMEVLQYFAKNQKESFTYSMKEVEFTDIKRKNTKKYITSVIEKANDNEIVYPDWDKYEDVDEGDEINHI
ncbi:hypothetical protein FACS1894130_11120 [Spirochaetia bacterium]|nr:hypothetical protein FACS1894130_11120 [Spirochaetia bacterium]